MSGRETAAYFDVRMSFFYTSAMQPHSTALKLNRYKLHPTDRVSSPSRGTHKHQQHSAGANGGAHLKNSGLRRSHTFRLGSRPTMRGPELTVVILRRMRDICHSDIYGGGLRAFSAVHCALKLHSVPSLQHNGDRKAGKRGSEALIGPTCHGEWSGLWPTMPRGLLSRCAGYSIADVNSSSYMIVHSTLNSDRDHCSRHRACSVTPDLSAAPTRRTKSPACRAQASAS